MGVASPGRLAGVLAGLALLVAFGGTTAPAATANGTGEQLRKALDEVITAPEGPPAISVLIQRGRDTRYLHRGKADLSTGAPPTRGQYYRIASMSKAFNGAVALALVSRGRLDLSDTIGELIPGVLPRAEDATLAQVLNHTASLPDYTKDPQFLTDVGADPAQFQTPLELMSYVAETEPEFDPGFRYEYSDTDNVIVGLMAEAATGETYDQLLERLVYASADLEHTTLPITVAMPEPYLHGYEVPPSGPPVDVSELLNPALAWASGGIVSNAVDVGRFMRAYVGGDLFNASTRRAQEHFIIGSSSPPGPGRNRASLGLFRYKTRCGTVFGHTGSYPGYRLFAASTRNGNRSVVFTVNAQIAPPNSGSQEVSDLIRFAQEDAVCHTLR
jgi:D-alanyl-D-alanine carboxypeptidase